MEKMQEVIEEVLSIMPFLRGIDYEVEKVGHDYYVIMYVSDESGLTEGEWHDLQVQMYREMSYNGFNVELFHNVYRDYSMLHIVLVVSIESIMKKGDE